MVVGWYLHASNCVQSMSVLQRLPGEYAAAARPRPARARRGARRIIVVENAG